MLWEKIVTKFKQWRCDHTDARWVREITPFYNLSGDRYNRVCEACGKQVDTQFVTHD